MSTRSRIARRLADGRFCSIYCHFDGDLVGQVLREHFPLEANAEILVNLGDLSGVYAEGAHAYKDRGEPWQRIKPKVSNTLEELIALTEDTGAYFLYIWQEGSWQTIKI